MTGPRHTSRQAHTGGGEAKTRAGCLSPLTNPSGTTPILQYRSGLPPPSLQQPEPPKAQKVPPPLPRPGVKPPEPGVNGALLVALLELGRVRLVLLRPLLARRLRLGSRAVGCRPSRRRRRLGPLRAGDGRRQRLVGRCLIGLPVASECFLAGAAGGELCASRGELRLERCTELGIQGWW